MDDYSQLITIEPGKRDGQPCVRGMPITVRDVLEYLAGGMTVPELLADFPELTVEDVWACFAHAASQLWDEQIELDERAGRLDFLIDRALEDHRAGRTRPLLIMARRPTPGVAAGRVDDDRSPRS